MNRQLPESRVFARELDFDVPKLPSAPRPLVEAAPDFVLDPAQRSSDRITYIAAEGTFYVIGAGGGGGAGGSCNTVGSGGSGGTGSSTYSGSGGWNDGGGSEG